MTDTNDKLAALLLDCRDEQKALRDENKRLPEQLAAIDRRRLLFMDTLTDVEQTLLLVDMVLTLSGEQALPQLAALTEDTLEMFITSKVLREGIEAFGGKKNKLIARLEARLAAVQRAEAGKSYSTFIEQAKHERGGEWASALQIIEASRPATDFFQKRAITDEQQTTGSETHGQTSHDNEVMEDY